MGGICSQHGRRSNTDCQIPSRLPPSDLSELLVSHEKNSDSYWFHLFSSYLQDLDGRTASWRQSLLQFILLSRRAARLEEEGGELMTVMEELWREHVSDDAEQGAE